METEIEEDLLVITWVPEMRLPSLNDKSVSTSEETAVVDDELVDSDTTFAGRLATENTVRIETNAGCYRIFFSLNRSLQRVDV